MGLAVRPLIEVVAEIPEVRKRRGIRHPQVALLAAACAAMLCGRTTYAHFASWGRSYAKADRALLDALGFTHPILPGEVTFYHLFRRLDIDDCERRLGTWAEAILAATAAAAPAAGDGIAIDGKTLRGSKRQGAPGAHLLAAVSHRLQQTLGQGAVEAKTNEIPLAPTLLANLLLRGRVVTMDALLTQREIAQTVLDGGGDYVMVVKDNQPNLAEAIGTVFTAPPPAARRPGGRRRSTAAATAATRPVP
jgi:hypothetical protein